CVLSNNREAKVLERCNRLNISALYFNRHSFYKSDCVLGILRSLKPDLIVLAGFLWKLPENLIREFPDKIINIHPALLPKYGGKGMYGIHVHKSGIENRERKTGSLKHNETKNHEK